MPTDHGDPPVIEALWVAEREDALPLNGRDNDDGGDVDRGADLLTLYCQVIGAVTLDI